MNALDVSGVSVVFGGLKAVDDLSFAVTAGSVKGVIGPNGAGKTTLFNAISGITRPSSGKVCLHGADVSNLAPHSRAALGLARTFQNLQIFRGMSVIENVMVGRHTRLRAGWGRGLFGLGTAEEREAEAAAFEKLVLLALSERAGDSASSLSFADAKLLEIARALAAEPTLLLLDEPLAGVPVAEQNRIIEVIRQVNARGVTIVLVEHNMRVVMSVCTDILVMDHGRRLAEGDPVSVARHPDVVRAYLGGEVEHA